jgi:signal peptidase II
VKKHSRAVSFIVFAVVVCMVVVLDRITKTLAVNALSGGGAQAFIPGFLDFQLIYNTGAAWGMLEGARALLLAIAFLAIGAMILYLALMRRHSVPAMLGLGMIAGGAIGNTIDRALSGQVVDFIHTLFIEFPFFNLADSAITVGVVLFAIAMIFGEGREKDEAREEVAAQETQETGETREQHEAQEACKGDEKDEARERDEAHGKAKEPPDAPL